MTAHTLIEPARQSDVPAMARLTREAIERGLAPRWTGPRIAAQLRRSDTVAVVARAGEERVGFGIMRFGRGAAHLALLAVAPERRRRGVGRALVEWLEATARVGGIVVVHLEARASGTGALEFYRQLGYEESAVVPRYYDGRESAVRMLHILRYPSTERPLWSPPRTVD